MASKVNKLHYKAFKYDRSKEEKVTQNYLVKNDGSKVYGNKITWKVGLTVKDHIKIDDQRFPISEVKGYRKENFYYTRFKGEYIQRIVHGKINVYVQFTESFRQGANGASIPYTRTDHYAQKGDDGDFIGVANPTDIKALISDCPLSLDMMDISNSKLHRAIKHDQGYLNDVFEIYNNDCKPIR